MSPVPRKYNLPPNLSVDKCTGRYRYRNPLTGKRQWVGKDKQHAIAKAELYNKAVELKRQQLMLEEQGIPLMAYVIDMFISNVVPFKPWANSTRKNKVAALRLYKKEFGNRLFNSIDRIFIADWLETRTKKADTYNEHRHLLGEVWKYAISKGWCQHNEALATLERSNSLKLAANRKERLPLDLKQFWQIHDVAPKFLQVAMQFSLVTLQGRSECCNLLDNALRGDWLYIIRQKTSGTNDMAFLRIEVTEQIRAIRALAFSDGIACPYWVRRRPASQRPQHLQNKPHPFYVEPGYLSKAFAKSRDASELRFPGKPPTFNEIRGLGSRLYREAGHSKEYVRMLMAHSDDKVTDIYLNAPGQLRDDHYQLVRADLRLGDLR